MDKLDNLMFSLPGRTMPEGLAERLQDNFEKRYRYQQRVLVVLATVTGLTGIFLIVPGLNQLYQLILKLQLSWESISASLNWIMAGNAQFDSLWYLGNMQGNWVSSLAMTTWLGLFLLGCGSALALNAWLPTFMREA